MINQIQTIKSSIQKALIDTTFDLSQDYTQIGLEQLFDNSIFTHIPIVKTIVGIVKGTVAVREMFFAKKVVAFIQQFHLGQLDYQDYQQLLFNLNSDPSKREKIVEQVIIMNDRYLEIEKSVIHANLVLAHLYTKLTWQELNELLPCLDQLHLRSIERLSVLEQSKPRFRFSSYSTPFDSPILAVGLAQPFGIYSIVSLLGRKLYYYGVLGNFDADIDISDLDRFKGQI